MLLAPLMLVSAFAAQDATSVRGEVRFEDAALVIGASVLVTCGEWRRATTTDATGRFRIDDVPRDMTCELRAEGPEGRGGGIGVSRRFSGDTYVSLTLPTPLSLPSPSPHPGGLRLAFTEATRGTTERLPLPGGWSLSGMATGSAGVAAPTSRPRWVDSAIAVPLLARPTGDGASPVLVSAWSPSTIQGAAPASVFVPDAAQGWQVGLSASRRGPWGTLFTGTARARREGAASTLLNDVTDTAMVSSGAWSMLTDPSRTPMLWDVRLRIERRFDVGAADLTIFGEAYRSWLGGPARTLPLLPLGGARTSSRSGPAARAGIKVAF